jgi:hypothetical protein
MAEFQQKSRPEKYPVKDQAKTGISEGIREMIGVQGELIFTH